MKNLSPLEVLKELVELKDMKDEFAKEGIIPMMDLDNPQVREYRYRKPLAWESARTLISGLDIQKEGEKDELELLRKENEFLNEKVSAMWKSFGEFCKQINNINT